MLSLFDLKHTHTGGVSVICAVREADVMVVLLIRSEPSEEPVAAQDPGSRAQIIRGAPCGWGHTGVGNRHLISCHKARQPINTVAAQLLEKVTVVSTHTHTHMDGLRSFVFTVRLGNVPSFLLMTDTLRQLHAHVLTQVHTQTHPDRCCIVKACPTLAACFSSDLSPCVMTQRRGDERRGRDKGEERSGAL